MKNKEKIKNKGITLIALVITIIVLLILAGITISTLGGDNGLFARAKQAKNNTIESQEKENMTIADYEDKIDQVLESSRDTVTISKDEYQILKNGNSYSTTEKEIG